MRSEVETTRSAHIALTLDAQNPIEIGDFVGAFTSISGQYQKFVKQHYPDVPSEAEIYVAEVARGSIKADLIPWAATILSIIREEVQREIIREFVKYLADRLSSYFHIGGRYGEANKSDLADFMGAVKTIANDPNGTSQIESVEYVDGKKEITAAIKFTTEQARIAAREIEHHKLEIEAKSEADHTRVLMVFVQSNVRDIAVGRRTGERVVIEDISPRDLGLIYASSLAEERIKHEIREADDNVFKKGFIVDVNVQFFNGRAAAYRVTEFHSVIELPEYE